MNGNPVPGVKIIFVDLKFAKKQKNSRIFGGQIPTFLKVFEGRIV